MFVTLSQICCMHTQGIKAVFRIQNSMDGICDMLLIATENNDCL